MRLGNVRSHIKFRPRSFTFLTKFSTKCGTDINPQKFKYFSKNCSLNKNNTSNAKTLLELQKPH